MSVVERRLTVMDRGDRARDEEPRRGAGAPQVPSSDGPGRNHADLAAVTAGGGWRDLALNPPGIGVTYEAARRRQAEGAGADRSWRVGADGEAEVAALLATLTQVSRWDRWRGRRQEWFVLHSVPLGDGHGHIWGDVDHLVVGPPGVVSINTKNHRTGKLVLGGDELILNGHRTAYVPKARREAQRVTAFLRSALTAAGSPELAARVPIRPLIVVVGGRLVVDRWPVGVTVVMTSSLIASLRAFPAALAPEDVDAVYALARRDITWNPTPPNPEPGSAPPNRC
jgi:Nuclease-related domain